MLMRTFLLVLIAVLAATSVSCQDFPISAACNSSSTALDNPSVDVAESYINKTGCTKLNFDINYINTCPRTLGPNAERRCDECSGIFSNTSAWESAVSNSSGRACYIDLSITLIGTQIFENQTYPYRATNIHKNFSFIAVGNACNDTEIGEALLTPFATEGVGYLDFSSLNANSNAIGVTWTTGRVTVSACGVSSRTITKVIPSSNSGSGSGSNTNNTSSDSGSGSNSNSTSSPTTVPPVTPAPTNISSSSSSSSSSTGGKGTGTSTGNGNGNGASVMMHSATAVMVALISAAVGVTVICAA